MNSVSLRILLFAIFFECVQVTINSAISENQSNIDHKHKEETKDTGKSQHHKNVKEKHQHISHRNNVNMQKCQIICPNQPPLNFPPNFLNNCSNYHLPTQQGASTNKPATSPSTAVTPSSRPASTTQNSISEEESDESSEEESVSGSSVSNGTVSSTAKSTKSGGRQHHHKAKSHSGKNKEHHKELHRNSKHKTKGKNKWHKITTKNNEGKKSFHYRFNLSGCYIACLSPGAGSPASTDWGAIAEESGDYEFDDDPYIQGEDVPIEITIPQVPLNPVNFLNLGHEFPNFFNPLSFAGRIKTEKQTEKEQNKDKKKL